MATAITGARVFTGETFLDDHAVVISGGLIAEVLPQNKIGAMGVHPLDGGILAPGFIDVQVNGGGGALLNTEPSVETVRKIASSHRQFGTTGLLPTVITDAPHVLAKAIAAVRAARAEDVPGVLGIHIEGPFLDKARKGAHEEQFIRTMSEDDARMLCDIDCGKVMVTLAPNCVEPRFIRLLAEHGVLVSLGHSDASFAEARHALDMGARAFTHLYNAMSQLNGREPGTVGAALADDRAFVGIIADGQHVHDAALRIAFAARPDTHMMLITDAMPTAAGGPATFTLQGRRVNLENGRLQLADGTLAGSNLTMDEAARHCVLHLKIDLGSALRMASLAPARFLGLDSTLGRIAPGYRANLVHLSDELRVTATWIEGQ